MVLRAQLVQRDAMGTSVASHTRAHLTVICSTWRPYRVPRVDDRYVLLPGAESG